MAEYARITIEVRGERELLDFEVESESEGWLVGYPLVTHGQLGSAGRHVDGHGKSRVIDKRTVVERVALSYNGDENKIRAAA